MPRIAQWLLIAVFAPLLARGATAVFPHPERIKYDAHGLQLEGRDTFVLSGAFHYFRCPRALWPERFEKIKAAGFNAVETYVPWNWHERQEPQSVADTSKLDLTELNAWLRMAEHYGLYIIVRPGPYICAEWSGGGFPQWLVADKKPEGWPEDKSWLQTDDPTYLGWARHWYEAVCAVVAPHQITRRAPGTGGVILFQIENEYERLKWLPRDVKRRQLEALANCAHEHGIDVPLVTCWTKESRGVRSGPLAGVIDCVNRYPRWDVGRQMRSSTSSQQKDQPGAPLMSMELQAGWYTEVGGVPADLQDGIQPVQTQNLTLFCLQLGYSMINYYMLAGGTNFDDWASRETTTSYDYFAPIRENGGVGEKYQRVAALGAMLQVHGARLVGSELLPVKVEVSDPRVEIAVRRARDGSRYVFVRTEDRTGPHVGTAKICQPDGPCIAFPFALEPFGSLILYLPPGATTAAEGAWLPKTPAPIERPPAGALPSRVVVSSVERRPDALPTTWTVLPPGDSLERHGIFDRHFIYYRVHAGAGAAVEIGRTGDHVIKSTPGDGALAAAAGVRLEPTASGKETVTYTMPQGSTTAVVLFENRGLQQHTDPTLESHWKLGLTGARSEGRPLTLEFGASDREPERGRDYSRGSRGDGWTPVAMGSRAEGAAGALLTWYRFEFELPRPSPTCWVSWELHLEAAGNGFIYLNGHCIGRTWDIGPQRSFFLPACWLNFGPGQRNVVAVSLRPVNRRTGLLSAAIEPAIAFAEQRVVAPATPPALSRDPAGSGGHR